MSRAPAALVRSAMSPLEGSSPTPTGIRRRDLLFLTDGRLSSLAYVYHAVGACEQVRTDAVSLAVAALRSWTLNSEVAIRRSDLPTSWGENLDAASDDPEGCQGLVRGAALDRRIGPVGALVKHVQRIGD
jgi:hypothetical protein